MKRTESGSAASVLLVLILAVWAVGASIFAFWAFQGRQNFKNNSDQISKLAVAQAEANQKIQLQAQFNEQLKSPYKTFSGSATYGSVTFKYPNTWSSYVDTTNDSEPINGYFMPGDVPGTSSNSAFALRVELSNDSYDNAVGDFNDETKNGTATATAYVPPQMKNKPNVQPGTLLKGAVGSANGTSLNGQMLIIPVRDKTLKIYTLSNQYVTDFANIVLANLSYSP